MPLNGAESASIDHQPMKSTELAVQHDASSGLSERADANTELTSNPAYSELHSECWPKAESKRTSSP